MCHFVIPVFKVSVKKFKIFLFEQLYVWPSLALLKGQASLAILKGVEQMGDKNGPG